MNIAAQRAVLASKHAQVVDEWSVGCNGSAKYKGT
ncbi:MAG: hypothetical protein QG657_2568 [Acidobacteriota bacterium]|nr:hypothetical protein [Acidobacteriota bacterium]